MVTRRPCWTPDRFTLSNLKAHLIHLISTDAILSRKCRIFILLQSVCRRSRFAHWLYVLLCGLISYRHAHVTLRGRTINKTSCNVARIGLFYVILYRLHPCNFNITLFYLYISLYYALCTKSLMSTKIIHNSFKLYFSRPYYYAISFDVHHHNCTCMLSSGLALI